MKKVLMTARRRIKTSSDRRSTMTGATLAGAITTGMSAITTVSERIEAGVAMGNARGLTVKSFKGLLLRHRLH